MSVELIMPKAGLTNTDGIVGEWRCGEGEQVKKDQVILEIENEKVAMEYNAPVDGILHIAAQTGETVLVGQAMGWLAADREEYDLLRKPGCDSGKTHAKASPLAKKLAADAGIELGQIPGSGPEGRILAKDVEIFVRAGSEGVPCPHDEDSLPGREPVRIPMTPVRKVIAERMYNSLHSMAQTSDFAEVDVTELVDVKRRLVEQQDKTGVKITLGDLLARAVVKMLKRHPLGNASIEGDEIVTYPYVNLSVAVAADHGLTSPVVKNADQMSLAELSMALKAVVERARDGRLTGEDLTGGTVTVTNMGVFPVDCFNAIINPPQSLIVGFGRATEKPAVYLGEIVVRTMMWISVTYDHRVFDGSEIGAIMSDLKRYVEHPDLILL